MANIVGLDGKPANDAKAPPKHSFAIEVRDGIKREVKAEGYLIATSAFVAVGTEEGGILALVPMGNVLNAEIVTA